MSRLAGVVTAGVLVASSGCTQSPAPVPTPSLSPSPAKPAPSQQTPPSASTIYPFAAIRPSASQPAQDAALIRYYRAWQKAFVRKQCGSGQYQVYAPDADYPFVAEAQGYGMVITASMANREPSTKPVFDGLLTYVLAHPSDRHPDLMAAEQDRACHDRGGASSATDGDMDIAYGLLLADVMWGSEGRYDYRALASRRIHSIKANTVHPGSNLMLLGDWSGPDDPALYRTSRTSDWMPQHFTAFEKATKDPDWSAIRASHRRAVAHIQSRYSPGTGLLPDFVESRGGNVEPVRGEVLETRHDGDYHFNACRTPWRLGVDAITSGDKSSTAAVRKINAWFRESTGDDPNRVGSGYTLGGERYDPDRDNAFWAPLAVAAMTDRTGQRWLDALWAKMAGSTIDPANYFGSTIQLQVMLVVTGHWTAP
ncbi:hypothetical protein HH310_02470 [Actinoplanes sp. TBRC 11911]|uniref:glycosyl hydrolase family 8 n=1 Tax=Actinoplanes sp. TBRC 11911 TaxID=2729386 RepID=UPI00145C7116|nr:glycosyl hydrolase family 8 [Actinoplanes sp. TBRC 11911]NMO50061.1 hypothetical protein [Actinoplanes sp. TBRC 11911]